jgi:hypothetical protein
MRGRAVSIFRALALTLGVLHAWVGRNTIDVDGIAYLDLSDAVAAGSWRLPLNIHWSPLYPWLIGMARRVLGPTPYWEFPVLHLVNFLAYLGALASFEVLLDAVLRHRHRHTAVLPGENLTLLPDWMIIGSAYPVFLVATQVFVRMDEDTPDMVVLPFMLLAVALLLRFEEGDVRWGAFVLFGILLGLGYLAKVVMFPLAFLLLLLACPLALRQAVVPRLLLSLLLFLALAVPHAVRLSSAAGQPTLGRAGHVAYESMVNRTDPPVPLLPGPLAIHDFTSHLHGTLPLTSDLGFWYRDTGARFRAGAQLIAVRENIRAGLAVLVWLTPTLMGGALLFALAARGGELIRDLREERTLLLVGGASVALYLMVRMEARYIAGALVLLVLGALCAARLTGAAAASTRLRRAAAIVFLFQLLPLAPDVYDDLRAEVRAVRRPEEFGHSSWRAATALAAAGVRPGDRVAVIGVLDVGWARLARVQVSARLVMQDAVVEFWALPEAARAAIVDQLFATGATLIVTRDIPPTAQADPRWRPLGTTPLFGYRRD